MKYEIGMLGLGVMGKNLSLNMADHGISVVGYDLDKTKVAAFQPESKEQQVRGADSIQEFVDLLREPRVVMMLVPAGAPVDSAIASLMPYLKKGDILIDGGNSFYKNTNTRSKNLAEQGIQFFGVGISGGESGARHGPSLMPGGSKEGYERVRPILEAAAARVNNEPCVAYLGPGSAGHFVKMIHNGIEYGLMQLISETYDFMKRGLGLKAEDIQANYAKWNQGNLNSYLMEITSKIFTKVDEKTKNPLIDEIRDIARQKGTGMWTSLTAMELQVPIPTIDWAVTMRDLSMEEEQRKRAKELFQRPILSFHENSEVLLEELRQALTAAMIVTYAQGMALLTVASDKLNYHLNLETIARIWRGGCIIRSALLEDIREAYKKEPLLSNLLFDLGLAKKIIANEASLRHIICSATEMGLPIPGFMSTLSYIDSYRSAWLPANLIQAQRDYFGSHTYERIDSKGSYHTEWE